MKKIRQNTALFLVVLLLAQLFPYAVMGEDLVPAGMILEYIVYILENMQKDIGGFTMDKTPFEGEDNTVLVDYETCTIRILCRHEERTAYSTITADNGENCAFMVSMLCSLNVGKESGGIPHEPFAIHVMREGVAVPLTEEEMLTEAQLFENID